ncbi:MAG: ABC transporter ATP-binding protein [Albidovulum sp.]|nr:ABC transporter ATP-binding protein [Albidovulum sp.]MDE0533656.1 ABC transporter ATP-binding protein [Albidovulum sp.]
MLLEVENIAVSFGKVAALRGISINVGKQSIVAIIGANGAGKSTTLRAISGLEKLQEGEIRFEGEAISNLPPDRIVGRGIAHVPEGRRVFPDLTVEENLRTGAFLRTDAEQTEADLRSVFESFPRLLERIGENAKTLSGGEQQMLAIGRALMAKPRLLLMDEPSMGLAPVVVDEIAVIIRKICAEGVPVVLVEQNAQMALRLADYAYVLETGTVALEGNADSLLDNDHVRAAYLGV